MGLITIAISLLLLTNQVLPFNVWDIGKFYTVNEGFLPKRFENEYIKFDTCLQPLEEYYWDKRMFGAFTAKKKFGSLGAISEMFREGSPNVWTKATPVWNISNVCETGYSLSYLEESLSGKWDQKTCSLEAGTYILRNFTMENDIKNATNGRFPYGHYKIVGTLLADIEGVRTTVATVNFFMWMKDEKNKKYEPKPKSKKGPKCDQIIAF